MPDQPLNRCQPVTGVESRDYVIRKNGYFYRPEARGYCADVEAAGRWTHSDAIAYKVEGVTIHHVREFLSAPKASVEPADGARPSREELARTWLRGTWFDGDAAAFEGCGDHPEWLAALNGADALLASWPAPHAGSGVQTEGEPAAREIEEILNQLEDHSPNWVAKLRAYISALARRS
jgi:hypothetical protein